VRTVPRSGNIRSSIADGARWRNCGKEHPPVGTDHGVPRDNAAIGCGVNSLSSRQSRSGWWRTRLFQISGIGGAGILWETLGRSAGTPATHSPPTAIQLFAVASAPKTARTVRTGDTWRSCLFECPNEVCAHEPNQAHRRPAPADGLENQQTNRRALERACRKGTARCAEGRS
jgi:hypothetical protein